MGHRSDTGPFALVPAWVLALGMSSKAVHLYAILAHRADRTDGKSWPSRKQLAKDLGCKSVDTVDRAVAELVEAGALEVQQRRTAFGDRASNLYFVRRADPKIVVGGRGEPVQGGRTGPIENHNQDEPDSLTGESTENGASTLVAYYVETYRKLHGGMDPTRQWKASAGTRSKAALKEYPPDDVRKALFVCANENKNPGALFSIIADYHRDRAKGKA